VHALLVKSAKQTLDNELTANEAFIGAIDVGSNAMRLGIATRDPDGTPHLIQRFREPVRLGHDAFTTGILSKQTMDDAVEAFQRFRGILDRHHIDKYRAIATSAMRDSENGHILARRILDKTGIKLELISGDEEAQLVHYSICRRADLTGKLTLLVDMGGGSVEVTLCDDGKVVAAQSFKIGTVRLLEILGEGNNFNLLLREYLDGTRKKLREMIGKRKINLCIATGGNASAIGELAYKSFKTESPHQISRKFLRELIKHLAKLNLEARIRELGLRPDRADVILPATMVFHDIMSLARVKNMAMPDASLLDGIALDMMDSTQQTFVSKRLNLLAWVRSLKKKYHVDKKYGEEVSRLALELFDQSMGLHHMDSGDRLLLEIASLTHELGMYVRVGGHHRHAAYLISASPLIVLDKYEKLMLSQIVRYQRKAEPSESHPEFERLKREEKKKVWQLSALLRVAIALNKDRRSRVSSMEVKIDKKSVTLYLLGSSDMLLERWAVLKTAPYFKQALGRSLHMDLDAVKFS